MSIKKIAKDHDLSELLLITADLSITESRRCRLESRQTTIQRIVYGNLNYS
jgi:hypothetical protein